jgi:hypothetical protein
MRTKLFACAAMLAAAAVVAAAQEEKKKKSDENNRTITVTGCVDKGYLHVRAVDAVGSYAERYRLRGPKDLLKEIAAKYDKHVLEVTGVATDLTGNTVHRGKTVPIGKKTTIHTGAKDIPQIPVGGSDATLEVASFREMTATCQ